MSQIPAARGRLERRLEVIDRARRDAAEATGTATDADGRVQVTCDAAGTVVDVLIDPRWYRDSRPEEIAAAVRDACRAAGSRRRSDAARAMARRMREAADVG